MIRTSNLKIEVTIFKCISNIIHVAPKRRTNIQTGKKSFLSSALSFMEHQGLLMAVLITSGKKTNRKSKVKGYC